MDRQTDTQIYSSQYFATAATDEVMSVEFCLKQFCSQCEISACCLMVNFSAMLSAWLEKHLQNDLLLCRVGCKTFA